jgi:hypothetical protein
LHPDRTSTAQWEAQTKRRLLMKTTVPCLVHSSSQDLALPSWEEINHSTLLLIDMKLSESRLRLSKVSFTHFLIQTQFCCIDKLYWICDAKPPQNFKNAFFFNIDNDLTYFPFNKDFGPLNLAMVHRYSRELARLLRDNNYSENRIFHYCSSDDPGHKMVNGAFLMGAFMIVILKMSAEQAHAVFKPYHQLFKHFRDASRGDCFYNCTLLHVLQGLEYA